jgi:3-phosphoshikimate 1-carboxyvinyltransferase
MIQEFNYIENIHGDLSLQGDKSISHRAIMFASMAQGKSVIHNCLNAADVNSTINCFNELGCKIEIDKDVVTIVGKGFKGFDKPLSVLNAGNSGTTARLLAGILCAQDFETIIAGDESLSKRPMKRIIDPLTLMGASIKATENFTLPLQINPSNELHAIKYELEVASAQVKSAILLAGLHIEAVTQIIEKEKMRNHTENLLALDVREFDGIRRIKVSKNDYPHNFAMTVPSDISSAAFFIVYALLSNKAELILDNVLLNDTRTGILRVLKLMGADIQIEGMKVNCGEKSGTLKVKNSKLQNIVIDKELIPNIIDEIPILSVAGVFAEGKFEIRNAKELRYKESDRIKALCDNYRYLGLKVEEFEDGFSVEGSIRKKKLLFESFNDHRIAMAFAVLSMLRKDGGKVNNFECVQISNPGFLRQIREIT